MVGFRDETPLPDFVYPTNVYRDERIISLCPQEADAFHVIHVVPGSLAMSMSLPWLSSAVTSCQYSQYP